MSFSIKVFPTTQPGTSSTVILSEKGNGNISCTSSGNLVPTITWTINNQPIQFSQTDIITNPQNENTLCTGTNTISGSPRTDSAIITVVVLGKSIVHLT